MNTTEDYDAPEVVPKPNFENKKTYKNKGPEPEPPQSPVEGAPISDGYAKQTIRHLIDKR